VGNRHGWRATETAHSTNRATDVGRKDEAWRQIAELTMFSKPKEYNQADRTPAAQGGSADSEREPRFVRDELWIFRADTRPRPTRPGTFFLWAACT
jgi:hypothetical protein